MQESNPNEEEPETVDNNPKENSEKDEKPISAVIQTSPSTNTDSEEEKAESEPIQEAEEEKAEEQPTGSIRSDLELINPVLSYDKFYPGRILGNTFTLTNIT